MTIIEKMNGDRIDVSQYGFTVLKISPIDITYDSESVRGRPGRNRVEAYHGVRKIQLKIQLQAKNIMDTYFLEEKLAEIFDYPEPFYLYDQITLPYKFELPGQKSMTNSLQQLEREPIMYKRFLVERINNDAIEWDGLSGSRTIELETMNLPYAQSPYTSLDFQSMNKEWDVNFFNWNNDIDWDDDLPSYSYYTNEFTVKNLGNITVNPRYCDLDIRLTGNFENYVQITNVTTGDIFRYNGPLNEGDTLLLSGTKSLKNNVSVINDVNHQLLSLVKGDNIIRVEGGTIQNISFDFPFYYIQ